MGPARLPSRRPRARVAVSCAVVVAMGALAASATAAPAGDGPPEVIRAEVGSVVRLTIRIDRPGVDGSVELQRRTAGGGAYATVSTLRLDDGGVRAAVRVPRPGRYLFRARFRHDGVLRSSRPVVVRAVRAQKVERRARREPSPARG